MPKRWVLYLDYFSVQKYCPPLLSFTFLCNIIWNWFNVPNFRSCMLPKRAVLHIFCQHYVSLNRSSRITVWVTMHYLFNKIKQMENRQKSHTIFTTLPNNTGQTLSDYGSSLVNCLPGILDHRCHIVCFLYIFGSLPKTHYVPT